MDFLPFFSTTLKEDIKTKISKLIKWNNVFALSCRALNNTTKIPQCQPVLETRVLFFACFSQFEGIPVHPHVGRFWEIIEKYKVTKFYTAPTAIRLLMKYGREPLQKWVKHLHLLSTAALRSPSFLKSFLQRLKESGVWLSKLSCTWEVSLVYFFFCIWVSQLSYGNFPRFSKNSALM